MQFNITVRVISDNPNVSSRVEIIDANTLSDALDLAEYTFGKARIISVEPIPTEKPTTRTLDASLAWAEWMRNPPVGCGSWEYRIDSNTVRTFEAGYKAAIADMQAVLKGAK